VTLQKSAKLKLLDGVFGARPKRPVPPGVFINAEGRGVFFEGGVEGKGASLVTVLLAGVGVVARNMSKSAPSSPVLGVRDHEMFASLLIIRRCGGGVRGGGGDD